MLLTEHYTNQIGSAPSSAATKGVIIHTAIDAGNTGPDFSYGWGLVDAAAAAKLPGAGVSRADVAACA